MKQGFVDHVALAQTPQAWPLFSLFATVKGRLAFTLGIGGANPVCHWWDSALSGRFMWCGGSLLSPEKAGLELGRWGRCFGSSGLPRQSCRVVCFLREGKMREEGRLLLAEDGVMRNMAPPTNSNAQKATLWFTELSVDRVIQRGVPPGVWSWMYDSNLYTAKLCYQSGQLNLSAKPGSHSRQQIWARSKNRKTVKSSNYRPMPLTLPNMCSLHLWLRQNQNCFMLQFYSNWTIYTGNNKGCH